MRFTRLSGSAWGELVLDGGEALLDGFRRALAASLGLVGLECFQIAANGPALIAASGEGGLVLIGHGPLTRSSSLPCDDCCVICAC